MKKGSVNLLIIFGLLFLVIGITVPYLNWMGGATWYDSVLLLVIFTIIGSLLFLVGRSNQKQSTLKESKNYQEISQKIKNPVNEFSSVDEYVDYALTEILFDAENDELSDLEKDKVKDELKKLGYI